MTDKRKPTGKHPGGKPPIRYDPDRYPEFARALAIEGLTNQEIADKLNIGITTLKKWMKLYPEFATSIKEGKAPADAKVEMSLYKKAIGFEVTEKRAVVVGNGAHAHIEMVTETRYVPPDNTSCIFWLKNRKPDKWRDKHDVEHSGVISWVELVKSAGDKPE